MRFFGFDVLNQAIVLIGLASLAGLTAQGADEEGPRPTGTVSLEKCQIRVVDRALLAAERNGVVAEVAVQEGDVVAPGRELLRLRDDIARAHLELVEARASNDVNVRFSRVLAETAKADLDAGLELEQKNAIAAHQLRRRKLEYDRGLLNIEQAEFEQQLARLEAAQARAELHAYRVRAPFAGMVTRVLKRRGESVQNGEPVLEIVNTARVQVEGYARPEDLWDVRPGAKVCVQLDAPRLAQFGVTDHVFEGELILVDVIVQPVTEKVRVVARVANEGNVLRDGLRAWMHIDGASSPPEGAENLP